MNPAYTHLKQRFHQTFSVDNAHPGLVQAEVRCVFWMEGVCCEAGAGSTAVSQTCVLRMVSLPRHPELGFLSPAPKAEVPGNLNVQIPPSSCPQRPKAERCKPLLTSYRPLLTPQMFTAISCALSPPLLLLCSGTQPTAHCCRCLTDRQTELPGWTGRVSEVMQSLLTSQSPKPAVHTHLTLTPLCSSHPAPHSSPELSTPTAPGHINHDPEGHLCHLEHHPGGPELYELQREIKQLFLLIPAFSLCNLLCPILLCTSLTNPPDKALFAHVKTTPNFHLHLSL